MRNDASERKPSGLVMAAKRRVGSWVVAGSSLSPALLTILVMVLLCLSVIIVMRLVAIQDSPTSSRTGTTPCMSDVAPTADGSPDGVAVPASNGNLTEEVADAMWSYNNPYPAVALIASRAAFYPDRVEIAVGG